MRACIQRVSRAQVTVAEEVVGRIRRGLVVLLGVHDEDGERDVRWMADKVVELRIFEDDDGKMNRSLLETRGELLAVSQFTLWGDCRKGRRPSFVRAAAPEKALQLYEQFVAAVERRGVRVATGRFRAHMDVELVNDGPVTLLLDSGKSL